MEIKEGIETRRAYRSLDPVRISNRLIKDLARYAGLAPSCFNHQPWRFVFVFRKRLLRQLFSALSKSNTWVSNASMVIAVCSRRDSDCQIKGRDYYLFDTGMASAFMILRATELGLVAHPIAGFDEGRIKTMLNIPDDMTLITLIVVGRKSGIIHPELTEKQAARENERPERLRPDEFAFLNRFGKD